MNTRHYPHWPREVPKALRIPETSIWYNLEVSAHRYPDKPAFICYDNTLTFRELAAQAEALAGYLQKKLGVKKGDRVLLFAQNSLQFVASYYAILRADAVVVPINPMNLTEELRHFVQDSGAKVAIAAQELWPQMAPLTEDGTLAHAVVACYADYLTKPTDLKVPDAFKMPRQPVTGKNAVAWVDAIAARLQAGPVAAAADDLAVMPYTSGTTGRPKGCMHSHRSVMATIIFAQEWFKIAVETIYLGVLPYFHVTGMQNSMNTPIYCGSTVVLLPRWDREVAGPLISRYGVTAWTMIPTMAVDLLASPNAAKWDLRTLSRISGGGAAMPEAVATKLKEIWGLSFVEGYGLTETMAPSHVNPPDRPKKQCLGIPITGVDSRVIDPATMQELPPGEVGEIITHGPQVFLGYWGNEQATKDAFFELDGKRFFRTGDLGRIDEEGYFFMVDRLKRMINASGMKVWPAEVESFMYAHPDIQEACVISAKDAHRGETVKALVVLKPDRRGHVTGEQITAWAREKMAAYKVPRIVEFVDALPKSATGKILWRALQEKENAPA